MPEVIQRLNAESMTLYDFGMKRLRQSALAAVPRLGPVGASQAAVRVWYDAAKGTIEILFRVPATAGGITGVTVEKCRAQQRAAVRATFGVGRIAYTLAISDAEQVRRRLGAMFAHEPVENAKEMIALGQRLATLTYLSVAILGDVASPPVTCRSPVTEPVEARPAIVR